MNSVKDKTGVSGICVDTGISVTPGSYCELPRDKTSDECGVFFLS